MATTTQPGSLKRHALPLAALAFVLAVCAILLGSLHNIVPRGLYWLERQAGPFAPITADQALTLGHFLGYAAAVLAGKLAFGRLLPTWLLVLSLFGSSLLIEITQSLLPYREASIDDLLANGAGLACGLLVLVVFRRWRRRTDVVET